MPRRNAPRLFLTISQKVKIGGEGEIRTRGAISDTTVFKTVTINRSVTSPRCGYLHIVTDTGTPVESLVCFK